MRKLQYHYKKCQILIPRQEMRLKNILDFQSMEEISRRQIDQVV